MKTRLWPMLLLGASLAPAQTAVAQNGVARTAVFVADSASEAERHAAEELARWLSKITGATIATKPAGETLPENAILVGDGPLTKRLFPAFDREKLGLEETFVATRGHRTLVAGGRPRGTVYAAYRLLDRLGCRWWTPWAETIPSTPSLTLPKLDLHETPAFESRDDFWYSAFDGDWAARNGSNGQTARLEAKHGGKIQYAGFVHTYYDMVPPAKYFGPHPEWYSLIDGVRTHDNAQLCTTDPALRDFIVAEVRRRLQANPEATIASVSQNDCYRPCQCARCQALVRAEGSESAPVLALANYVAERIEGEFPHVAIDTLAYQYTRKAPRALRPRPNVIVRLCSIECNFAEPLTGPSNASFAADIRDWSRLTNRLYIWNYNTNFARYPQPIPNYLVLGPNAKFFRENGVKGVFEQGAYQSNGGEMAELKAWVQARLLWNPEADASALIDEFLRGYYGPAAGPIRAYLDLMADASAKDVATIYDPPTRPFFRYPTMARAESHWQEAMRAVADRPDLLWRVRQGHLGVGWIYLNRWNDFRTAAKRTGAPWTLPESRKAFADGWLATATGPGPAGWTPMTTVAEGSIPPQDWIRQFAVDPIVPPPLPDRKPSPPLPGDFPFAGRKVLDAQDVLARLANEPDWAALWPDPSASDGIAVRMPGTHHEWAVQLPMKAVPGFTAGRWRVLVVVRAEGKASSGAVFSAGIYDDGAHADLATRPFDAADVGPRYRTYDLGVIALNPACTVWVAPAARPDVESVWVDRVLLVRE